MDAQNAQNWTASIVIGIEPTSEQNGGYARVAPSVRRAAFVAPTLGAEWER
jgi:hypothetical protein